MTHCLDQDFRSNSTFCQRTTSGSPKSGIGKLTKDHLSINGQLRKLRLKKVSYISGVKNRVYLYILLRPEGLAPRLPVRRKTQNPQKQLFIGCLKRKHPYMRVFEAPLIHRISHGISDGSFHQKRKSPSDGASSRVGLFISQYALRDSNPRPSGSQKYAVPPIVTI